jgi:hypothetical protein
MIATTELLKLLRSMNRTKNYNGKLQERLTELEEENKKMHDHLIKKLIVRGKQDYNESQRPTRIFI